MTRRLAAFAVAAGTVAVLGIAATLAMFGSLDGTQRFFVGFGWGCIATACGLAVAFELDPPSDGGDDG